jgi:hypothetical protein
MPVLAGLALLGSLQTALAQPRGAALVDIDVDRPLDALGVPVMATLVDLHGREHALAVVATSEATAARLSFDVVDARAAAEGYLIGLERRPGARHEASHVVEVLLDDGQHVIVRARPGLADELAELGLDIARLGREPLALRAPEPSLLALSLSYDAGVAAMIGEVQSAAAVGSVGDLSGENEVWVGGELHTITTRHTDSGTPLEVATEYAFDRFQACGLSVSFDAWSAYGHSGRNVIATKTGTSSADEIVLLVAHLDDMPATVPAPGADDNASGCTGALLAAEVMSSRSFERTIRFVLFTGEEQGLLGSSVYAGEVSAAGDDIVAVVNLDMVGWDGIGEPVLRLHTRTTANPGYAGDLAIANLFVDVVGTYGLSAELVPVVDADGITASDHSSFWSEGYAAILAIEDDEGDFCPYYHTAADLLSELNVDYMTSYVQAVVGVVAHLAVPATIFSDGFESGDTSAWSDSIP